MNICMVGYGMMGVWHFEALKKTDAVLQQVQDHWDAKYGVQAVPGRPLS
ncbi:MAG: hypothetical protein ACKVOI_12610 [Dongiaceae bacterium]